MTRPVLYSFRRCPYAMRARWALLHSGLLVEWREVALRSKPAALLERSPKGTVPVLITAEGQVIDESLAVMGWALDQADPCDWRGLLLTAQERETIQVVRDKAAKRAAALQKIADDRAVEREARLKVGEKQR